MWIAPVFPDSASISIDMFAESCVGYVIDSSLRDLSLASVEPLVREESCSSRIVSSTESIALDTVTAKDALSQALPANLLIPPPACRSMGLLPFVVNR